MIWQERTNRAKLTQRTSKLKNLHKSFSSFRAVENSSWLVINLLLHIQYKTGRNIKLTEVKKRKQINNKMAPHDPECWNCYYTMCSLSCIIHSTQSFWVPKNNPFTTKPCADSHTFHTVWVTINSFTAKLCTDIFHSHFGSC